ncbi:hypothetical protein BOTBODRAFT_189629 [Botryobasidium botryosum FD-172 SS1]|uniref:Terpene synthase n=1 Tax=Botryobasidium botryosum (strain FD-172 SS1) TaxID=930990 RepID=A0A067MIV3_BOTB1|nr:hypothetical protein BOTBODRAFT_189629 [Botryobasidium botryosum FD-172 SS1]
MSANQQYTIPDFDALFTGWEPTLIINPHYERVRAETDAWLLPYCQWKRNKLANLSALDFTYVTAVTFPGADYEQLKTVSDYFTWAFVYDDRFDVGEFAEDADAAERALAQTYRVLTGDPSADAQDDDEYSYGLDRALKDIWRRAYPGASRGCRERFIKSIEAWFGAVHRQIKGPIKGEVLDVKEQVALRTLSVGDRPCYALTEWVLGLDLPEDAMKDPAMVRIHDSASRLMFLVNDILSWAVEKDDGLTHNTVSLIMVARNVSLQEAVDEVTEMIRKDLIEWQAAKKEMGRYVDDQVRQYILACERWIVGSLHWSFRSKRYYGNDGALVRACRVIHISQAPVRHQPAKAQDVRVDIPSSQTFLPCRSASEPEDGRRKYALYLAAGVTVFQLTRWILPSLNLYVFDN